MLMSLTTFQAFTPVAILLISWVSRLQEPNRKLAVIVCMISTGVALASQGELHFNLLGFLTQSAAVAVSLLSSFAAMSRCPPRYWLAGWPVRRVLAHGCTPGSSAICATHAAAAGYHDVPAPHSSRR